ncbi:folate-binding protein YgfZ [Pollutimonas subterranea]|uniref:Folate-binding protein YgfZ n=2 Tax=Pollutimonas subterranea TaxID=2045210 RepID=A0A2N4U7Q5_9BURK|nr:folate-binding protein YgfZ [Pollutimonas subterranea]
MSLVASPVLPMKHLSRFVAPLNDLAVIGISGPDAAVFLHGQLTHDITGMASDRARLAGYCTAKGRLLGSMVVWSGQKDDASVLYALVKADIASALIKRLSMFVLRAKVTLQLSSLKVLGITVDHSCSDENTASTDLLKHAAVISAQQKPWDVVRSAGGTWIAAPSDDRDTARWWFVASDPGSPSVQAALETTGNGADDECWRAADIAAGLPWIDAATQDIFIPQTLNLDLIDGVSFTKGCYPGQEVVARSHYRGTVKRRMAYGIVAQAGDRSAGTLAGTDIYKTGSPDAPCGRIINAASCDSLHVLIEVQLSDLPTQEFRLEKADGPVIELLPLPYRTKVDSE